VCSGRQRFASHSATIARKPLEADFVCFNSKARASARVTLVKLAQLFLNVHVDTTKKNVPFSQSFALNWHTIGLGSRSREMLQLRARNEIIRFVVLHPRYSLLEIMDAMDMFDIAYESQLAHRALSGFESVRTPPRSLIFPKTGGNYQRQLCASFSREEVSFCFFCARRFK
jgi:hypothetical protein